MKPALVVPFHDPDGVFFPHLETITPQLRLIFDRIFVSITPRTSRRQTRWVHMLEEDPFFRVIHTPANAQVGDQFHFLYFQAAYASHPDQVLHLAFIDRVIFALETPFKDSFMLDIAEVKASRTPLIFQRSTQAWETHPHNYFQIEQMATHAGTLLFQRSLDFNWCHLAIRAEQLMKVLPSVKGHDLSMLAEFVLELIDTVQAQEVDWLAWEDPHILGRKPVELKVERERSLQETHKRLGYVIPTLEKLLKKGMTNVERVMSEPVETTHD